LSWRFISFCRFLNVVVICIPRLSADDFASRKM
jgi:hypothetical protein